MKPSLIPWLLLLLIGGAASATERHYQVEVQAVSQNREADYYATLLKMILEASKADDEVIDIHFADHQYSQARWIAELQKSPLNDVIWTITTNEREQLLQPIRVPLVRGLLGKRVLVIRKADAAKFAAINSLAELKKMVAGQGANWPDAAVLQDNDLAVSIGKDKETLYKMLLAKRFDYFPRGVTEIASERDYIASNDLMVEPHLILSYPNPMYFFVNKNNPELAMRLEKGWHIILKNGRFNQYFSQHPRIKNALDELKRSPHRVLELRNKELPAATPLDEKSYWLDVTNVK